MMVAVMPATLLAIANRPPSPKSSNPNETPGPDPHMPIAENNTRTQTRCGQRQTSHEAANPPPLVGS
jgi:hypothetical protein